MKDMEIKLFGGMIIGKIKEDFSGKRTACTYSGVILGTYNPRDNYTRDFSGRILCEGDILSSLIMDKYRGRL